jgi:IS30 family transposase
MKAVVLDNGWEFAIHVAACEEVATDIHFCDLYSFS